MNWRKWVIRAVKLLIGAGVAYVLLAIGMTVFIILMFIDAASS